MNNKVISNSNNIISPEELNFSKNDNLDEKKKNIKFVRELFNKWNEWLKTKSPEVMADFYSDNCLFLPTLNWEFKKWKQWAKEYFEHFLQKNPIGKIIEDDIIKISDDFYIHVWMYDFEVDWKNWRKITKARFTFIWKDLWDNNWKIIHHHSSLKPLD